MPIGHEQRVNILHSDLVLINDRHNSLGLKRGNVLHLVINILLKLRVQPEHMLNDPVDLQLMQCVVLVDY
jgi:hypothetical protein